MADKEYHKQYRKEYSKKVKYLNVSIPVKTYKEMQDRADSEGVKVTSLLRNMAIAYMQQTTYIPKEIEDELKQLSLLIRNVANNVNQVAHHSNVMKGMVNENDLLAEIKKLDTMVHDYTLKKLRAYNDY